MSKSAVGSISRKGKKPAYDFYRTPSNLARLQCEFALASAHDFFNRSVQLEAIDPGMGRGVYGRALRDLGHTGHLTGIDIHDHGEIDREPYDEILIPQDFLMMRDRGMGGQPQIVIMNPPYSAGNIALDTAFILKALECIRTSGGIVSALLRVESFCGQRRYRHLLSHSPPSMIRYLVGRPQFMEKGSASSDYCIAEWWPYVDTSATWVNWKNK